MTNKLLLLLFNFALFSCPRVSKHRKKKMSKHHPEFACFTFDLPITILKELCMNWTMHACVDVQIIGILCGTKLYWITGGGPSCELCNRNVMITQKILKLYKTCRALNKDEPNSDKLLSNLFNLHHRRQCLHYFHTFFK